MHLLVATVQGRRLEPILDDSRLLGLGRQVDTHGRIAGEARADLLTALGDYVEAAGRCGAGGLAIVATEPLRRASDAADVVAEARALTDRPIAILSHEEEAWLTLVGLTGGAPVRSDLAVIDIGGGTSELVLAPRRGPLRTLGLPLGSARLTSRFGAADPPTERDLEAMAGAVRALLRDAPDVAAAELVAVGGTASNLPKVLPGTLRTTLDGAALAAALEILRSMPAAELAQRFGLRPERARILPAGAVILAGVVERYGLPSVRVSDVGIREGAILALARAGGAWREELPRLARGLA